MTTTSLKTVSNPLGQFLATLAWRSRRMRFGLHAARRARGCSGGRSSNALRCALRKHGLPALRAEAVPRLHRGRDTLASALSFAFAFALPFSFAFWLLVLVGGVKTEYRQGLSRELHDVVENRRLTLVTVLQLQALIISVCLRPFANNPTKAVVPDLRIANKIFRFSTRANYSILVCTFSWQPVL